MTSVNRLLLEQLARALRTGGSISVNVEFFQANDAQNFNFILFKRSLYSFGLRACRSKYCASNVTQSAVMEAVSETGEIWRAARTNAETQKWRLRLSESTPLGGLIFIPR
jgi:hypothetical protein